MLYRRQVSNSLVARIVAAGLLAVVGVNASAAAPAAPRVTVSQANADAFRAIGEAMQAKRYADVDAKAKSVLANPQRTKDDVYAAYGYMLQSAQARKDVAGQMAALQGQLESGILPAASRPGYYRNLMGLAYQVPDYPKAIEYGQEIIKAGNAPADVYQYVGQAYYKLKDYKSAVNFFSNLVSEKEKAGKRPDRNELILLQQSYSKAGNADAAEETLKKVVHYYPDPSTWNLLIHDVKGQRMDYGQKLHFYRLMQATGNLKQKQDYFDYYNASIGQGLYAESKQVMDAGLKANVFPVGADKDKAERYLKSADAQIAKDPGKLAAMESAAKAAATGNEYIDLGSALYASGQYPKAVEAFKAGIAKGSLKNAAAAQMNLGMALIKAGQKGEALKAFRAARSDDETTQRLAELWALHSS